jgi:DNA-binding NarL/FixJ family response regulator
VRESLAGGVLIVTDRPAVAGFITGLSAGGVGARATLFPPFPVRRLPMAVQAVAASEELAGDAAADVGLVDLALDPAAAADVCRALRRRWPELPLLGLLCCPRAAGPDELRALAAAGVHSLVDLQVGPDGLVQLLRRVARGEDVLHVRLPRRPADPATAGLHDLLRGPSVAGATGPDRAAGAPALPPPPLCLRPALTDEETRLAELVAQGLGDRQIGGTLSLSTDTIHHHIQRLCQSLGVRNKTELASWAGLHGLYHRLTA